MNDADHLVKSLAPLRGDRLRVSETRPYRAVDEKWPRLVRLAFLVGSASALWLILFGIFHLL